MAAIAAIALGSAPAANASGRHAARHHRPHKVRSVTTRPIHFKMPSEHASRRVGEVAMISPRSRSLRLSIDHSWGGRGAGSLGYQRLGASPLDPHSVNAAAGTQFGVPASVVGGSVSYRF